MKAEELMIGDWVNLLHNEDGIVPYYEVTRWEKDDFDFSDEFIEVYIHPIPLTPEILEKNGFVKELCEDIIWMASGETLIEIGNNYRPYEDGRMYLYGVLHRLYYVHELQHALKLCGIDKEIVI